MFPSLPQYLSVSASAPATPQCTCRCCYPHFMEEKLEHRVTKAIGRKGLGASPAKGWIKSCFLWSVLCFPLLSVWQWLGLLRSRLSSQATLSRMPTGPICQHSSCFWSFFRKTWASSRFAEAEQMTAVRTADSSALCVCVDSSVPRVLQRVKRGQSSSCVASLEGCLTPLAEAILHLPKHDGDFL